MRAVIIGGGDFFSDDAKAVSSNDFVICADGGYNYARQYNIHVDLLLGDMDSIDKSLNVDNIKKFVYPKRKDLTDSEIAIEYVIDSKFTDVILLGLLGNRVDHSITNAFMLYKLYKNRILAIIQRGKTQIMYLGDRLDILDKKGTTLSIVPLSESITDVTTVGLDYPLNHEDLFFGKSRGVSNVITGDACSIQIKKGRALVILEEIN